ncbi:hypothetical protein [Mangrovibacterium diazotrophicum]|uniref:Uncharacterized protein n=1 Tax=Mangrovibacterium diazotrophicum TaxID=1261403 RepID=A0A419W3D2_9BACT|nr:hypothetical protein [Mangrovibacterium diazotrophicum]RKD89810.1 hypothetical protein BC643_0143 [Mangrovibacterium diazotrophicum]
MAVKKSTSSTPRRSSRGTKIDFMKATNNIGKPIAAVAGFAVGKYALKKLEKSQTVSGLLGNEMKTYIVPAAVTMGGLVGTQFTKNEYVKLGLVGAAGAGVESIIKKATGKTILQGLEGIIGDEDYSDVDEMDGLRALNPITQALPAADIDIEREIQASVSGAASDYSMSDDPVGNAASDYAMSDEPIGSSDDYDEPVGKIQNLDPDSMDYDIFSGDMMAS